MRILIIHTRYHHFGGEDSVVDQEIKILDKKYTVDSLIFKNHVGFKGALLFASSIWNIKKAKIVKAKIKAFKPDIVHLHNWHFSTGPIIIRTIKKMGVPLVCTLHNYRLLCPSATLINKNNLFLNSLEQNFPWNAINNKVYKNSRILTFWLAFIVWSHKKIKTWDKINCFICLTPSMTKLYRGSKLGINHDRFFIKPHFVFPSKNNEMIEKGNDFIYVGRLSEEKGIHLLVQAFKHLPYNLKIIGDGPMREMIEKNIFEHKNISYLGSMSREDVFFELRSASALINPSICLETFGLTIIESFSNHCAVITTNIGGPSEIVTNGINGIHFKIGDVEDLKRQIKIWFDYSDLKKEKMRNNAFQTYLELYSPDKQFGFFEDIYEKALNEVKNDFI